MKAKVIKANIRDDFEGFLNEALKNVEDAGYGIIDVKYSTSQHTANTTHYSALITYK